MKRTSVLLTALLLASGTAMAQYKLDTVVVHANPYEGGATLSMSCNARVEPTRHDLNQVLNINDQTQTRQMRLKFMTAIDEACAQGVGAIVIERGKDGQSLTWQPVGAPVSYPATVETVPGPVVNPDANVVYPATTYPDGTVITYPDGHTVTYPLH